MKKSALSFVARWIIIDSENRILLVKHTADKPWTLPGGHLEDGETFQECFIREVQEELGLEIELIGVQRTLEESLSYLSLTILPPPIYVQVIEYKNDRGLQRKYEEFFIAKVITGEMIQQNHEIFDVIWMNFHEIQELPEGAIYENLLPMMAQYFSQ